MTLCDVPIEGEILKDRIVETFSCFKNLKIWWIAALTALPILLILKDAEGASPDFSKPAITLTDGVCLGCTYPEGTKDPMEELLSQIHKQKDGCMIPLDEPDLMEELLKKLKNEQK